MSSFNQFLEDRMTEEVSKEGQISQYEKSLERMNKARNVLLKNGMDTTGVESQIQQVSAALERRKSSTHKWYGAIVRIDQEPLNNVMMWRLTNRNGDIFHVPMAETYGIIKIPQNWQNLKKPMNKFIEYREEPFGNQVLRIITYTENRTVDIVPIRTSKDKSEYYLIRRRDSGLWATVGGHVEEGELGNPIVAARRELKEETGAIPLVIKQLPTGWIRETITNPELHPSREYNSWTLPYIAIIHPDTEMVPADDAIDGDWYEISQEPPDLHFSCHKKIIEDVKKFLPTLLKQFGKTAILK